jgi:hypothetical protein
VTASEEIPAELSQAERSSTSFWLMIAVAVEPAPPFDPAKDPDTRALPPASGNTSPDPDPAAVGEYPENETTLA